MKLWEIFRYDVASQLRRYRAALYCLGISAMTLLVATTFLDDARRDGIYLNSPIVTAACIAFMTMIGLLVAAAVAGEAATRDTQARMDALLYTTPVNKLTYLGGRFLAAFAVMSVLLTVVPLTLAAGMLIPGIDPSYFGPIRPASYLHGFLIVGLPNAFVTTALLFALVLLTRRPMTGYLGAAALFANTLVQDEVVATALGRWDLAKRFDVFGFMALRADWRSLSVTQRNTLYVQLSGDLLVNRLLWLGVALVALTFVVARFRMAHYAPGRRWSFRRQRSEVSIPADARPIATTPRIRGTFDRATRIRQLFAIAFHSYRELITSRAAWILPLIGLLLMKITPELMEVAQGTPGRPTTGRVVMLYAQASTLGIFISALTAFFAGQLVWRERDAREHDIVDATPVPDVVSLTGKFGGLVLLLVTLQVVQMTAGIVSQMSADYTDYQPLLYLKVLFGLKLIDYLLFAALAMAVQVVANQKYLGTAIVLLAWLYSDLAGEFGIRHNLLIYGADPGVRYSDISLFGASLGPWLWFKLYWFGWALAFALLARLFWVRGHEGALKQRIALARRRFTMIPRTVAAIAIGIIAIVGGFVFYNTNLRNEYLSDTDVAQRSADYEKRYGRYATLAQPVVAATKLRIELHPSANRADVRGTYRLENRSGRAIDAIHLVTHRTVPTTAVAFDRPARASLVDETYGYRIYTLARPLAPGDSLRMDFEVRFAPRGFTNRGISTAITANGTLLEHRPDDSGRTWLPGVGYRRGVELSNAYDRRMHGLPPRPASPPPDDIAARNDERGLERIDLETIIGTDADQTAIAPGALRRSWIENGRRYFHYATETPIRNGFPILSARYAVHRSKANGVDIEVLYHPQHAWNVERMARSARAALDYYSREFGRYPHRQLRLVEFPSTGGNRMTGHPITVIWSETIGYAQPEVDWRRIDFPYAIVAHEVAHQWWGNTVTPARAEGAPLVSESLAWYSAMKVVEETLGRDHFDRTMNAMRASYLTPHETPEVPLLRAGDWLGVYRTGALAIHALREAIGTPRVNTALRDLADEFGSGKPPFATSLDLYRHLRAVTPADTQPLLKDLFEDITFWDLRMKSARSQPLPGGAHRVTLEIEAYKVKVGAAGRESRVPMNDLIDIAVFAPAQPEQDRGTALYAHKHRIRSGLQTITVTVPSLPASAGIDADSKLLDRNRADNVKDLGG